MTALATAVALVGLVGSARATTALYLPIEDLYHRSDLVVRGTILSHTSYWTDEGQMFTDWTLQVNEVLYGPERTVVTFRQLGGTVDDLTVHIPGDAVFEDGEHVVVFLVEEDGVHYLTALGQSKLSVSLQGGLGVPGGAVELPAVEVGRVDATLVRDLSDITFYNPEGGGQLYQLGEEILTLEALRELRPATGQDEAEEGAP